MDLFASSDFQLSKYSGCCAQSKITIERKPTPIQSSDKATTQKQQQFERNGTPEFFFNQNFHEI